MNKSDVLLYPLCQLILWLNHPFILLHLAISFSM
uniref:Uncharacterized protein n=1 Tax=Lepeophtheirus salmonis TaxID=72036 RepID=A0A0K2U7T8_LEPSM